MRIVLGYRGDSIELPPGESILGRALTCRIRFNDPAVSRQHLRFFVAGDRLTVEDLGSANGSQHNGQTLTGTRTLADGDWIQVGGRRLRVHFLKDAQPHESLEEETLTRSDEWSEPSATGDRSNKTPAQGIPAIKQLVSQDHVQIELREHTCPRCRNNVPISTEKCHHCGYNWPPGRPMSVTQRIKLANLERRREPRRPIDVPILYASETLTFDAVARDLSRGGMFVATELLDPVGTACNITVLPDGGAAVSVSGVVCHVVTDETGRAGRPPGMGVKFTVMGKEAMQWLMTALSKLDADGGADDDDFLGP